MNDTAGIKSRRTMYLAVSTFTLLFLGLIYAFSMFAAPMCETFGYAKAAVALTFNIMMISFCIGSIIGSAIEKAAGTRVAIIVSAVMFLVGFAGTGLMGASGIGMVYCFYGVLGGFGVGVGYNSIIATTNVWFPEKTGFSSGVLMMGFGFGSLILGNISVKLIPLIGLCNVFIGIGVATCVVTFAAALILRRPPENIVAVMCPGKASPSAADPADEDKVLKSPVFYVYWAWAIIVIAIGLATIGNCASDAQMVGWDAGFATLLVGLVSVCNGLSRVLIGIVFDKTNVKVTMIVDGLVAVIAAGCIIAAIVLNQPVLYVIGAFCCGFCYGGVPVVASAFARKRFGAKNYPLNLSLANFAIVFGSLLNVAIQAVVGTENRLMVFTVLLALAIIALLDVIPFCRLWNRDIKRLEGQRSSMQ